MIARRFQPPNYLCRVSYPARDPNRIEKQLAFANSAGELRQRLEAEGLTVHSVEPHDFNEWRQRAAAETRKAIEARDRGEKYEFKNALWTELKDYLFALFNDKCAYCESDLRHTSPGDVEHYRPKSRVAEDPGHPGYYWLAYEPENYLPSCEKCNRPPAKADHFPVAGQRAHRPGDDLTQEQPLLLNPYQSAPALEFSTPSNGLPVCTVKGTDEAGRQSVRFYDLNRAELCLARGQAQSEVLLRLKAAVLTGGLPSIFAQLRSGNRQFSAACRAAADAWWQQLVKQVEEARKTITAKPNL